MAAHHQATETPIKNPERAEALFDAAAKTANEKYEKLAKLAEEN